MMRGSILYAERLAMKLGPHFFTNSKYTATMPSGTNGDEHNSQSSERGSANKHRIRTVADDLRRRHQARQTMHDDDEVHRVRQVSVFLAQILGATFLGEFGPADPWDIVGPVGHCYAIRRYAGRWLFQVKSYLFMEIVPHRRLVWPLPWPLPALRRPVLRNNLPRQKLAIILCKGAAPQWPIPRRFSHSVYIPLRPIFCISKSNEMKWNGSMFIKHSELIYLKSQNCVKQE